MRALILALPVSLLVSGIGTVYAQGGPPGRSAPAARASAADPRQVPPASMTENCGTPDEPKPCPPMPRVPLQYYPENKR